MNTPMDLEFHKDFPHDYELEELDNSSTTSFPVHYFPSVEYKNSLVQRSILIRPKNKSPWVAKLAGHVARYGLSGLYTCPQQNQLCVVIGGCSYVLDTNNPTLRIENPFESVDRIDACKEKNILLVSTDPCLWAWGKNGLVWEIYDLAGSDLVITEITNSTIYGTAVKYAIQFAFEIDIVTGKYKRDKPDLD